MHRLHQIAVIYCLVQCANQQTVKRMQKTQDTDSRGHEVNYLHDQLPEDRQHEESQEEIKTVMTRQLLFVRASRHRKWRERR